MGGARVSYDESKSVIVGWSEGWSSNIGHVIIEAESELKLLLEYDMASRYYSQLTEVS